MLADMSAPASGPKLCPNCHAVATHHFCPKCGQPTTGWRAGLGELVHDCAGTVLGADARIWVSLRELFRRPGALTVAYFEGKRFRFLSPLRLYLFASLLMFMVWAIVPNEGAAITFGDPESIIVNESPGQEPSGLESLFVENLFLEDVLPEEGWFRETFGEYLLEWARHMDGMSTEERDRAILTQLSGRAPSTLFLFLPFLAAILLFVFWSHPFWRLLSKVIRYPFRLIPSLLRGQKGRLLPEQKPQVVSRKFLYFDHFIFCLNFMAFVYLLATVLKIVPLPGWVIAVVALTYPPIYFVSALRRVSDFRVRTALATSVLTFFLAVPVAFTLAVGLILVSALNA